MKILSARFNQVINSDRYKKLISVFLFLTLLFCACLSFYHTVINAVNLPFDDEFDIFVNPEMTKEFNFKWLLVPQGEAKIVLTRLLSWIFYHINGYNCISLIIFNFFLSCIGYFVLYKILKNIADDFVWLPLFFIPFFSDTFWMNRLISFQSQVYFMLLFSYVAIYYGLIKNKTLLSSVFCFLASISQTFVSAIPIFFTCILKEIKENKSKAIKALILPTIIISLAIAFGLYGFYGPIDKNWEGYIYPNNLFFYRQAAYLTIKGIFLARIETKLEIFVVFLSVVSLITAVWQKRFYKEKAFYPLLAVYGMFFSFIIADTFARGGYGLGILPWHFDFFAYIIPTIAVTLYLLKLKNVLTIYTLLIVIFHTPHFTQGYQTFKEFGNNNKMNAECVYDAINGLNNNICKGVYYSKDLTQVLNSAKRLNVSFVQTAKKHKKQTIEK